MGGGGGGGGGEVGSLFKLETHCEFKKSDQLQTLCQFDLNPLAFTLARLVQAPSP